MHIDVSIIIVNYNTRDMTLDCINSIFKETFDVNFEVILVDNDSHDGSIELFENDIRIKFIKSGGNIGFGRANNLGYESASGRYVFLLNSDTILLNNAVKLFYDFAEENKERINIGAIGTVLLNSAREEAFSIVSFKSIQNLLKFAGKKLLQKIFRLSPSFMLQKLPNDDVFFVDGILGADMFIPSSVYKEIEGFDPAYFMYGEEVEMQKRMDNMGYKRVIIRSPRIIHLEGGSANNNGKTLSYNTIFGIQRGSLYYIKKHYSPIYYLSYKFVLIFTWFPWILMDRRFNSGQKKSLFNLLLEKKQ